VAPSAGINGAATVCAAWRSESGIRARIANRLVIATSSAIARHPGTSSPMDWDVSQTIARL